jgi:maleylpyruvate isomerase
MTLSDGSSNGWDPGDSTGLDASCQTLIRTVDALTTEELAGPSLLPGWTRAHVVAHIALNGICFAGVLDAIGRGRPVAMYESDEQRDGDIEELAAADPSELRHRLLAATTSFRDRLEEMDESRWDGAYNRLPNGPTWPAVTIVPTRRREVEIHHADLGASYQRADWPADFVRELLDTVTVDQSDSGPFRVRATDLGHEWQVGEGDGPTVMGTGADLGWWLTGRGEGEGLACEGDALPRLGPWRRASATAVRIPER